MFKLILTAAVCAMVACTQALAQTQCDPKQLNQRLDRYAVQPFSALNWRVLNGLGDPGIDASGVFDSSSQNQDEYKKLAQSFLKSAEPPDIGYDCRVGYPLSVLQGHIAKFGQNDPYVAQWVKVQSQVFAACSQTNAAPPAMIDPLVGIDAARENAQRDDRAYQAASIAFYADKAKAIDLFRTIAAGSSPHKAAARYNIANLLANAKRIDEARKETAAILADPSLTTVHTITKELQGYIANLEDTAPGWSALINEAIETLSKPLKDVESSPDHRSEYARALSDIDYAGIRDKETDWWLRGELPENPTISKAILDATRQSPMALWMVGGQSLYKKQQRLPWAMRGDKWQQHASSYVASVLAVAPTGSQLPALAKDVLETSAAPATDEARGMLWAKVQSATARAGETCGQAAETAALPVYLEQAMRASAATGNYTQVYEQLTTSPLRSSDYVGAQLLRRLMSQVLATGNVAEGRRLRDALLTSAAVGAVSENARAALADDAARFKAWMAEDEMAWRDAVSSSSARTTSPLLNFLPVKKLWEASEDARLSGEERALFARAAWTRLYAQSRSTKDDSLKRMLALNPKIQATHDSLIKEYPKLTGDRLQLLLVLRNPRLSPLVNAPGLWEQTGLELGVDASYEDLGSGDHNDRNWWCPFEMDRHLGALRDAFDSDADMTAPDAYSRRGMEDVYDSTLREQAVLAREKLLKAHPVIKLVDWKGLSALAKAPSAPKKLTQSALAWGKVSNGTDGAPEALARAVTATRYGCNWHGGHGSYSKAAQTLLKAKFASTKFAADTPYWFDCMRNEWDDKGNRVTSCKPKEWPKQPPLR